MNTIDLKWYPMKAVTQLKVRKYLLNRLLPQGSELLQHHSAVFEIFLCSSQILLGFFASGSPSA